MLNSASPLGEVQAAYDDNALYDVDDSVAAARAFLHACRILQRRVPEETTKDGAGHRFGRDALKAAEDRCLAWLRSKGVAAPGDHVTHFCLTDYRV